MRGLLLALFLLPTQAAGQHVHPTPAPADSTDPAIRAFIADVRAATLAYRSIGAAIAAGYRAMGPAMPNMGEHWVNPAIAVRRQIEPERPAVLTYLRVDGVPTLTGVAYIAPVPPGAPVPPAPAPGMGWHFHSGDLAAEAFGSMDHDGGEGPRMAMAHAWIWQPNPAGLFAPDNWALPYLAAGLPVPEHPDPAAARAVSLLGGGTSFYSAAVRHAAGPGGYGQAVDGLLAEAAGRVAALSSGPDDTESELAALWRALWRAVAALVPEQGRDRVARFGE